MQNKSLHDDKRNCQQRFRFSEPQMEMIRTLSKQEGISENQVMVNALNAYYAHDIMPDHIVISKQKILETELIKHDRKLETLSGIMYSAITMLLGCVAPPSVADGVRKGKEYSTAFENGQDILSTLVRQYKNDLKENNISFMQTVWADMKEDTAIAGGDRIE